MKDWKTLTADEQQIMNKHFTAGRGGKKIDKVVIHHNAAKLSIRDCWRVWQTREASAHYQVDVNGRIGQLVWDSNTAWHAGDFAVNQTSIGIEHANDNTKTWTVSEKTLDNGAHLVAAICLYYGLGRPQWGKNVFGHMDFSATSCPGALAKGKSQHARYVERMGYWYDQMTKKTGTPAKAPAETKKPAPKKSVATLANEVIAGKWGNGDTRRHRLTQAGYNYNAVQAEVNKIIASRKPSAKKPVNTIVNEVIRGEWGNGATRKQKLTKAGYNYNEIQRLVNQRLGF